MSEAVTAHQKQHSKKDIAGTVPNFADLDCRLVILAVHLVRDVRLPEYRLASLVGIELGNHPLGDLQNKG